jgi:YD repeat-containing protein
MIPGQGSQDLLGAVSSSLVPNMHKPDGSTISFPIVTKNLWAISCLSTTDDGGASEAFLAVSPEGTKYWFNHLVYRWAPTLSRPLDSGPLARVAAFKFAPTLPSPNVSAGNSLVRREAMMLVTRVQDRFGNWLNYSYDGAKLTGITANDGRQLSVQYVNGSNHIDKVILMPNTSSARTWQYGYSDVLPEGYASTVNVLSSLTLPDGTHWAFDLNNLTAAAYVLPQNGGNCPILSTPGNADKTYAGSITSPTGLTGSFTVRPMQHARSWVPLGVSCGASPLTDNWPIPNAYNTLTAESKSFSGAGLATQTWQYHYAPSQPSWKPDCDNGGACPKTTWTEVLDPDNRTMRYTFSNQWGVTESELLQTEYFSGTSAGPRLRSEALEYAPYNGGPYPVYWGSNLQSFLSDQVEARVPLNKRTIVQDSDTYTWQAEAFDAYAHVISTKRFSSILDQPTPDHSSLEERTTFLNDTSLWVLGLPLQVTNVTTGEVESSNTYNSSNDTLLTRSRFGQPLMSYVFNGFGRLVSFTDANTHTTTLGNYRRGIPQAIGYPDRTSESLAVDDFGQIASITDQAGHTTSYSYDPVGRITALTYPAGDEVAWYPKTFSYNFVTSDERGVSANHWKRTTTTGSAQAITYFDAMLRPIVSDSDIGGTVQSSGLVNYDAKGQEIFVSYPSAAALNFTSAPTVAGSRSSYDALGRVTQVQQDSELGTLTSSTAYLSGARQQVTDPKGNITTTSYQVFDSPSDDAVITVQAPAGIAQSIVRDLYGTPLSITQSGLYGTENNSVTKTLTYDSYHRLCRTAEPESRSTVMAFDSANNLAWSAQGLSITGAGCGQEQVNAGAKTWRTYDAMNRPLTIQPPAGTQPTTYAYNALGNMTLAISGVSTWTGTYNYRGMLTGENLQLTGLSPWSVGYAHDGYGTVSQVNYPDGEAVSYAPDALGRASKVGSFASGIGYFPDGQVAQFVYEGGAAYAAEKNTRQMLSNFSYGTGGAPVLSEDLSYDKNGNILNVVDLTSGKRSKAFGYDALNRLTSATASGLWGTQTFSYDALNNLRTLTTGSQTSTYNYGPTSNLLASITSGASTLNSYLYDTRGNVTGKNAATLAFDQKNQLTGIAGSADYAYDASGRRVTKTTGGVTSYYFYSQAGQLMYQWEPSKGKATSFVYLGSKMIGDNESTALGSPSTIGFDTNPNNGSYVVSWGAVPAATSYTLQESANGGGWTVVYSGSAADKALSGRVGGSYTYRAQGCAGNLCGAWTGSATLGVRPVLPTLTVPGGTINGSYAVSWTAPATATSYDVQERVNGGAWSTIASNTVATTISRPGTSSGSYTYQVAAKSGYGTRGWASSAAVTVDINYGVLPAAPTALTVPSSSNSGSATINWSSSALTTRYVVQQNANGGATWAGIYNANGTSMALSGLADGSFGYQVQACNTYGCSGWTAGSAMLVVTHAPSTAPNLGVPAGSANGSYTVNWSGVPGPVSYTLQESANGGGWSTVQTNGMTSWSTSGRGNGSYGYRAQACNVGGCGPWSASVSTTVLLPPAAPASISIPASSNGPVAVSWAASATTTSYTLQHANYGVTGWGTIYNGGATGYTQYETVSGAWIYQVQACNASGCSVFRGINAGVSVTIAPSGAPSLSVPATSNTGSYTVSWSGVGAASSYTLQEQVNGGGWGAIQSNSATSMAIGGKGNASYGYRAQACNAGGCGPWSGTGTVTVALSPATPDAPSLSVTGPSYRPVVNVSWAAIAGATSYQVEKTHPQDGVSVSTFGSVTSFSGLIFADGDLSYRVKACSSQGCSPYGPDASVWLVSGSGFMRAKAAEVDAQAAKAAQAAKSAQDKESSR